MYCNFIGPKLQTQYCMSLSPATSRSRRKPLMQRGFIGPKLKTLSGYKELPIPNPKSVVVREDSCRAPKCDLHHTLAKLSEVDCFKMLANMML